MRWVSGAVLAVLATANLYAPDLGFGLLVDPTVLALVAALLLAVRAWVVDFRCRLGRAHVVVAVVAVTFIPGLVMAADHSYGRFKVFGILAAFAATWAALQLLASERVRVAFLWAVGASGAVVSVAVLLFGEYAGLNPIGLGRMAALGGLLAFLGVARVSSLRRAVLLAAVAGMCLAATLTTGARAPVVAAVLGVAVAYLPGRRFGKRVRYALAVVVPVGVVAAVAVFATASTGRTYLWGESLTLAARHPLGIGFGDLYGKFPLNHWQVSEDGVLYSHNVLIEALVEGGWLALAGLLVALVVSVRALWRAAATVTGRAMLAVWVYALVNALLSSDLVGNRLMWVMIGAGLALLLRERLQGHQPEVAEEHLELVDLGLDVRQGQARGVGDGGGLHDRSLTPER